MAEEAVAEGVEERWAVPGTTGRRVATAAITIAEAVAPGRDRAAQARWSTAAAAGTAAP